MASKTQIANIALARIGVSKQLANADTDSGTPAVMVRTFFTDDVDYVLRDFPWPWARSYVNLALVGGSSSEPVNRDWTFSYRYPSDCVFVRRIVIESLGRNDPNPAPYQIGRDSQGRLIFTNEDDAQIEYTSRIDDPAEFDAMFVSMLAWKLGASLAPSLSRIKEMATTCLQMYEMEKAKAESRALNESQQDTPQEAEMIRARD